MENNPQVTQNQPISTSNNSGAKIFFSLFSFALLAVVGFLAYNNSLLTKNLEKYTTQAPTPTTTPTPTLTKDPTPNNIAITPSEAKPSQWQQAKHGGVFSYMYPTGWHVAELWPEASGSPIRLAMDPNPITTAPMGGPSSIFNIYFYNGLANPDAKLSELKSQFKPQDYTDIKTETIESINGPVYYQSGKMSGEYMNGTKVENYIFTVKKSAADLPNVQVMQATLYGGDQKQSEMFRYVVLSFKPL